MAIAAAAEIGIDLKKRKVKAYREDFASRLSRIPWRWDSHARHRDILDELEEIAGREDYPDEARRSIVIWMAACWIGAPARRGLARRMSGNTIPLRKD